MAFKRDIVFLNQDYKNQISIHSMYYFNETFSIHLKVMKSRTAW